MAFRRRNQRHRPVSKHEAIYVRHQARLAHEEARQEVLKSYLRFVR